MGQSSKEVARRLKKKSGSSEAEGMRKKLAKEARGGMTRSQYKKSQQGKKK